MILVGGVIMKYVGTILAIVGLVFVSQAMSFGKRMRDEYGKIYYVDKPTWKERITSLLIGLPITLIGILIFNFFNQ